MKAEHCVIPARCSECGEVFDLSYDLETRNLDRENAIGELMRAINKKYGKEKVLCWECRI